MYRTIHQFQVLRENFPSSNGTITTFSYTSSVSTKPLCNFWCGNNAFHEFPVWQWHFPSTSEVAVAFLVCRLELTPPSVKRRDLLSISSAPTVLSFPSSALIVWRCHLCSGGAACVAAAAHSMRQWHLPCSEGTTCATAAPPVWWWHLPCSSGTSHETAAPPLRRKHFGYTSGLAEALLVPFQFSGRTFGASPVWWKHFWCTSGLAEALLVPFQFSGSTFGASPVWWKQFRCTSGSGIAFRFGGNTFGLVEALLVWRKHFWCDRSTSGALLVQWQHFWHFVWTFCPLPVRQRDLLAILDEVAAPSVHFCSIDVTCRQLLEGQRNLPSTFERVEDLSSVFGASIGPFVNY